MADQSRWFIKEKPLEERIKACQKSLDAAIRSQRANIVEALRTKLSKLEAERCPKRQVGESQRPKTRKKPRSGPEVAPEESKTSTVKKRKKIPSKPKSASADAKSVRMLVPDAASTLKTSHGSKSQTTEPLGEKRKLRKKVKRKTQESSSGADSGARATAIDLLLRAAAKAKAARQAAGEESEEEAPMPELPIPRKDFAAGGFMMADQEEVESEEEEPQAETPRAQGAADDDDFFDVEDSLPTVPEAGHAVEVPRSERGAARREKKMRRKERLEHIRQERFQKHPSWVAAKSPRVNGAFSSVKGKGKRTNFESDSG